MNSEPPIPVPSPIPLVNFIIPVSDELRERLDRYAGAAQLNQMQLAERIFDKALREFLDAHAPVSYRILPQEK